MTIGYSDLCLIKTDDGDRPQLQLVHLQGYIERPSRLVRFATHLGLANGGKPMLKAVEEAYEFIARNYASGDQVILCASTYGRWETDPQAKVTEVLAQYLYGGTSPAKLADAHPGNRGNMTGSRIPIYGVVVWPSDRDEIQSMTTWSDWLKSRLPPSIQRIVCFINDSNFRSCSTAYDLDSEMISRELRFSSVGAWQLQIDATKHLLYYEEDELPKWDKHQLVWTCILNPSFHQAQDALASESMKPAGMYHHEVRRYPDLLGADGDGSMLVWKSCRKAPK